jgi:hypothetical protein
MGTVSCALRHKIYYIYIKVLALRANATLRRRPESWSPVLI